MTGMDVKGSRIRDAVRDSKILRDIPSRLHRNCDSFTPELNQGIDGVRHHLRQNTNRVERDLPRLPPAWVCEGHNKWKCSFREENKHWVRSKIPILTVFASKKYLLEWIDMVECFFEEFQPPEQLKCKLAYYALEGEVEQWWKQLQHQRVMGGESKITLWPRMKFLLINDFWPTTCSTKCPLRVCNDRLGEKCPYDYPNEFSLTIEITAPTIGNYVEQMSVSSVMPNKCSIEGPLESYINYINTQDWKNDLKSHEVSVSSYKDDGIETLKKSAPYTSLMEESATKSILFDIYLAHGLRSHLHDLCVYGMLMVRLTSEEMKMTEENKSSLVSTLVVWVGNQRCDNTWAGNTIFTWDQLHLSPSMVLQFRFQSQPLSMQERFSLKRLPTVLSSIVLGELDELESEMTKIRGEAPLFLMSVDHHVPRQHALIRDFSEMQGSTLIEELQSHILNAIVVTCTIILSTYSMIGKSEHEYEEAHVYLTDAFCTIGEHDELLEEPWHFNCYITRGRVILWEGWNDTNNTNMERKLIMGEMSVVIIDACGNVLWENGQLRESLKLFHNVLNGLDPPVNLDGACEAYEIDLSAVYPIYKTLIVADSTLITY